MDPYGEDLWDKVNWQMDTRAVVLFVVLCIWLLWNILAWQMVRSAPGAGLIRTCGAVL